MRRRDDVMEDGRKLPKSWWRTARDAVWRPKVDEQALQQALEQVRGRLPTPVFWLLGKTQSGKTSLIKALTGASEAEIGNGYRPCTRTSRLYPFPNEDACVFRFLDTRGLGEVDYDPKEDIHAFESQAHLLVVVVKAMDHAQQCVLEPLKKIRKAHPRWPVLVLQTCLHEGYPRPDFPHPSPYPFDEFPPPPEAGVPEGLVRSLAAQRRWFEGWPNVRFAAVDLTLPDDGFTPHDYGLPAVWTAVEESLPAGLQGMISEVRGLRRQLSDVYFRAAHAQTLYYSLAAGAAGAIPMPFVDVPLLLAIQVKMCHAVAAVYGQPASAQRMYELISTFGSGVVLRLLGREMLKFVPVLGSVVAASYSAAATYAMGRTLCVYFSRVQQGDVPDEAALQGLWNDAFVEGRRRFSNVAQVVASSPADPPPSPSEA